MNPLTSLIRSLPLYHLLSQSLCTSFTPKRVLYLRVVSSYRNYRVFFAFSASLSSYPTRKISYYADRFAQDRQQHSSFSFSLRTRLRGDIFMRAKFLFAYRLYFHFVRRSSYSKLVYVSISSGDEFDRTVVSLEVGINYV